MRGGSTGSTRKWGIGGDTRGCCGRHHVRSGSCAPPGTVRGGHPVLGAMAGWVPRCPCSGYGGVPGPPLHRYWGGAGAPLPQHWLLGDPLPQCQVRASMAIRGAAGSDEPLAKPQPPPPICGAPPGCASVGTPQYWGGWSRLGLGEQPGGTGSQRHAVGLQDTGGSRQSLGAGGRGDPQPGVSAAPAPPK